MLKGITLPNVAFRPYSPAELAALDDLRPDVLVMLLYGGAIDQTHIQQITPYLSARKPRILYRPYAGNIPTWEPSRWASECLKRMTGMPPGELIPWNEPNLASEGGSEDWDDQILWLNEFAAVWDTVSSAPLHLPALSPTGNYIDGLAAYTRSGITQLFDIVDAHIYANGAAMPWTGGKPLSITEFNGIDPTDMFNTPSGARECVWFILGGTPDQSQYDLLEQPAYYQSFKQWRPHVPTPVVKFDVGKGVLDAMKAHADTPAGDENYVNNAKGYTFKSETRGHKGTYEWWDADGRVIFIPFP